MGTEQSNGSPKRRRRDADELGADLVRLLDDEYDEPPGRGRPGLPREASTGEPSQAQPEPPAPGGPPNVGLGPAGPAPRPKVPPYVAAPLIGWWMFATAVEQGARFWAASVSWPALALARTMEASRDRTREWLA